MKSFFLPVGKAAGDALPAVLSAMSCGAALPVDRPDILHVTDSGVDTVLPLLVEDINTVHELLRAPDNDVLFPSGFDFRSVRPRLPSLRTPSEDPAGAALLDALRGKGIPLSYKTDREAVEWSFSVLLADPESETLAEFRNWVLRIHDARAFGEETRTAVLCDLCDPFSAGAAFALLRFLSETEKLPASSLALFCFGAGSPSGAVPVKDVLSEALHDLDARNLCGTPNAKNPACADTLWLYSLPSSLVRGGEPPRLLFVPLAVHLSRFFSVEKLPAPGLHTTSLPGILTLQSLGDRAGAFASFMQASAWLLSDLLPALRTHLNHPAALRSLAPNTRNSLFKRLFRTDQSVAEAPDMIRVLERTLLAVLSEVLSFIRSLPDTLRLAEVSDPLWRKTEDACGRTVTVASEYDVSLAEAEEAGVLKIKPVHRVSMADTVEEKQERRLEDIAVQLKEVTESRDSLFTEVGECRALLALRSCRGRCVDALDRAREQFKALDPNRPDRLAAAALSRRIRLLEAAVSRCDRDLSDPDLLRRLAGTGSAGSAGLSPYDSQLLTAAAAEKLAALLSVSGDAAEPVRKDVRALLPSVLYGFTLSDGKALLRQLLASCQADPSRQPLAVLALSVLSVCRDETSGLHFLSAGEVPSVPLLPDLFPPEPPLTVTALLSLLDPLLSVPLSDGYDGKAGLLAMLLLRQYRRRMADETALAVDSYEAGDSPVVRSWLSARGSDRVWIVSLGPEGGRLPFALILPGRDLLAARFTPAHDALVPSFAAPWFDRETRTFRNPCAMLGEGDRLILCEQLKKMADSGGASCSEKLRSFLSSFLGDLDHSWESASLPDRLELRLKAAYGLRLLPAFSGTLLRVSCFYEHFLSSDRIASCLLGCEDLPASACNVPDDILYYYKDVPFARENSRTLLQAIPLPAEDWILNMLSEECGTLSRSSDDYHDALVREISLLLERCPDALPEARKAAFDLLEKANMPLSETETELSWPWDTQSPSVLTILTEALGGPLAGAALSPFSEMLTLFPARGSEIVGDSLMSSMCVLAPVSAPPEEEESPAVQPDAVLPPLSPDFCAALCSLPEGRTLVRPGMLSFERTGGGSVRVSLMLEGRFTVRFRRTYTEEEILHLYSHDIPTLAVWPNLPMAPEDWHAYYVYAALPAAMDVALYNAAGEKIVPEEPAARTVCRSGSFPLSFSFLRGGRTVGSVPNLLPAPEIEKKDACIACVDFGSVGTSVVFAVGRRRVPLHGPTFVRTLVNNPAASRDLLRREFLPALPVAALLPTASRIFRNVPGASPAPFEDGIVLMSSDLQDVLSIPSGALYTCLKWEEEKGRSVELCLHQIMLMAALQARYDGASSLAWRFAVPDEMARTGRERLAALFASLAEKVNAESGFSVPDKQPLVTFAAESSALGAYFRLCASEDTRGGFMVLDVGACTADISLFLRGREQAVRTCQIPLGVHYMLLPSLLRSPSLLQQDLGGVQDPSFLQDLALLEQILRNAGADSSALRHSRLALDTFLADRFPSLLPCLLQNAQTGMPTYLGSVLLLFFSYLMMLSGLILLQIAADPGKNDFLPEQMSLCLSGRGSLLLEALPDPYKTALWHFLTMFRNRRVASLSLLFSSEKKMEIPVGLTVLQDVSAGLPPAPAVPAAVSVRPEELLPQFLLRFAKEFPASAELLFHGFYSGDFYHPFTPRGEAFISEAIARSFTEQTALRPFDALCAWIGTLLELLADHPS